MIFSQAELMVLLSVLGGTALYGFWERKSYSPARILQAANTLAGQGVLEAGGSGFSLKSEQARELLLPMAAGKWAVMLTPREKELPQICYMVGAGGITGAESVAVQRDGVRLFRLAPEDWEEELAARGVLPPLWRSFPRGRSWERPVEGDALPPLRALLEDEPDCGWLMEYFRVPERRACRGVLIRTTAGERVAWICEEEKTAVTNDLRRAVGLPERGGEGYDSGGGHCAGAEPEL